MKSHVFVANGARVATTECLLLLYFWMFTIMVSLLNRGAWNEEHWKMLFASKVGLWEGFHWSCALEGSYAEWSRTMPETIINPVLVWGYVLERFSEMRDTEGEGGAINMLGWLQKVANVSQKLFQTKLLISSSSTGASCNPCLFDSYPSAPISCFAAL